MRETQSWEQMVKSMQETKRKQCGRNRSVPRDFRAEPRSLKGLINRLINSLAVVTAEPAGQAGWRRS